MLTHVFFSKRLVENVVLSICYSQPKNDERKWLYYNDKKVGSLFCCSDERIFSFNLKYHMKIFNTVLSMIEVSIIEF